MGSSLAIVIIQLLISLPPSAECKAAAVQKGACEGIVVCDLQKELTRQQVQQLTTQIQTFKRTVQCVNSESCPTGCTSLDITLKLVLHPHPKAYAKKESARLNAEIPRTRNNRKCAESLLLFADWNSNKMTILEESRYYFLSRSASSGKSLRQEAKQFFIQARNEIRTPGTRGAESQNAQRHHRTRRDVEDGLRPDTIGMIVGVTIAIILLIIFFVVLAICCNFFACYDRCFQKCGCNQCCPNCMSYYRSSACSCFDSKAARRAKRKGQIIVEAQPMPVPTLVQPQPAPPVASNCCHQNYYVENALVPVHSPPSYDVYEYNQPIAVTSAVHPGNHMVSSGHMYPAGQMVSTGNMFPAGQMVSSGNMAPNGSMFTSGQFGHLNSGGQFLSDGQMGTGTATTLSSFPSMQFSQPTLHVQ